MGRDDAGWTTIAPRAPSYFWHVTDPQQLRELSNITVIGRARRSGHASICAAPFFWHQLFFGRDFLAGRRLTLIRPFCRL
jgi:hypothetical protein